MKRRRCICVWAFEGDRETRVAESPRCPEHGDGGVRWRLAAFPPVSFLEAYRAARGEV
jgi:hypothetical protein